MRTYDDIQKELREQLTSPTWSNLKRGLLGQELISLAAYAIHSSDRGYSLFFRNFFPDTADKKGLLYLSGFNRVPIKFYKPAFIKIKMPIDGGMVYAPYSLVISTGALQYTNIGFIKGSSEGEETTAIFYQGKVRCITDIESNSLVDFGYRNVTYLQKTGSNHTVVTNDPSDLRTQIILPKYALPDSLKVYTTAIQIPVSEITGVTAYNQQSYAYYSLTELDETLRIVFGDGITSRPLSLIENVAVYYLELSFLKSNASLVELSYPAVSGIASKQISEADILSQFDGESYSYS